MNEFEAFCRAVELHRNGGWNPRTPDRPTLMAGARYRTVREICGLIIKSRTPLPDTAVGDLLWCCDLHFPDLSEGLNSNRTYAAGANCLLQLMLRREQLAAA
jgi:hypothetical protein